jgi:hypothetical protein
MDLTSLRRHVLITVRFDLEVLFLGMTLATELGETIWSKARWGCCMHHLRKDFAAAAANATPAARCCIALTNASLGRRIAAKFEPRSTAARGRRVNVRALIG